MLEHNAPQFTVDEATRIAQEHYGLTSRACRLDSYLDQNFLVETENERFVLKIFNAAAEKSYVDFQKGLLHYLENFQGFQRLVRADCGAGVITVCDVRGIAHYAWMVSWLDGRVLADVKPVTKMLLEDLGRFLGRLDCTLEHFSHSQAHRDYFWDLRQADSLACYLPYIKNVKRCGLVEQLIDEFETGALPLLAQLPQSIIHHDGNDHNVLVAGRGYDAHVSGLLDFGDALHTSTICELGVAATYVMLGRPDPVGAAAHLVAGYNQERPLLEREIAVLYQLIQIRLCSSVLVSAYRGAREPDNKYIRVSEARAWALLDSMDNGSPACAEYRWREACGMEICPPTTRLMTWLNSRTEPFASVMQPDVRAEKPLVLDLSVSSPLTGLPGRAPNPHQASAAWFRRIRRHGAAMGIGRYNEARLVYTATHFAHPNNEFDESRTIHLGIDLFKQAGTPVYAPLGGTVHSFAFSPELNDYGGVVILEHDADGQPFFTLYGHLSQASIEGLEAGSRVGRGEQIGTLGTPDENGGWVPHLHFQVVSDLLGETGRFWGVAPASQRDVWLAICPDPNLILGIPADCFPAPVPDQREILERRRHHIGGNLSISYRTPLHIVRGFGQYLYDHVGRRYLDAVNNVPHVGHSHPRVVSAARRQMGVLNTNTRYLHRSLVVYAERLAQTMPDPLNVCFFVNSGSEASDLALRLAYAYTRRRDVIVLEGAYHGHLSSLIAISPYKFLGPGGEGVPPYVHLTPVPDVYRGAFRGPGAAHQYAVAAHKILAAHPRQIAAFIGESLLGCGGQLELPPAYLRKVYAMVRADGGVCIADEVQVGFGRVGTHFWGFETQDVVPDIVVLGKPMGNGHPLAGVVTTPAIAASFDNGMEFFSTFGGNPVSCEVGMAVLDVIADENLQENAHRVGMHLKRSLKALMPDNPIIGDVRGRGLFLGVELVRDRSTRVPAPDEAAYVTNRMSERGVLLSTDGPSHNVLKIKPPMVFNEGNADLLVHTLDQVLREDFIC